MEAFELNKCKALIEYLKEDYALGIVQGSKIMSTTRDSSILPKKLDPTENKISYVLCRWDGLNYERVIANPRAVGTPKFQMISGQDFYSGVLHPAVRHEIMDQIKGSFIPHIKRIPYIGFYPLKITLELHDTLSNFYGKGDNENDRWDVDNRSYPYCKAFCDVLTALHKIKDDDKLYITSPPSAEFCPVENHEDRKLVFIITKDTRERVANHPYYKQFHAIRGESGETEDNLLANMEVNLGNDG